MAITTTNGKILPSPSVGKGGVEDIIKVDDEPKEECPVKSEKLDSSDDDLKRKAKKKKVVVKTLPRPPPPFLKDLKKKVNDTKFSKFI